MQPDVTIDYTDSMTTLLDWWTAQPCSCATIGRIAHETDYSRETIRSNIKQLMAADMVARMYEPTGEYRLLDDPREQEADA